MGKAKNLRVRVRSYFQSPVKLGHKTAALVSQISSIDHIEVLSEIEALLLESKLIKKWLPPYNVVSRDDKSPYYIHITTEKFPKPIVNHEPVKALAGPFLNSLTARQILKYFRRIAPYCTAPRLPGRPCLYSHLGLCQPCPGDLKTTPADYKPNIIRLKKLLRGQFKQVMHQAVKTLDFETAANLRDLLYRPISPNEYIVNPNLIADKRVEAVESLQSALSQYHPLIPPLNLRGGRKGELYFHRIEMYDVANLSGTAATAAMTVALEGDLNSSHYRHFTVRGKSTPDDVGMLKEILNRRLKRKDWPTPDLIVLDGGKPQLSIFNYQFSIPVIALAKKEEIIYTLSGEQIKLPKNHPGLQLLQRLRDEAHRFSRRLHHKHRNLV